MVHMSLVDQLCETPGCKNRGMKFERAGKIICRNCARRYDGKSPTESEEEREERERKNVSESDSD